MGQFEKMSFRGAERRGTCCSQLRKTKQILRCAQNDIPLTRSHSIQTETLTDLPDPLSKSKPCGCIIEVEVLPAGVPQCRPCQSQAKCKMRGANYANHILQT